MHKFLKFCFLAVLLGSSIKCFCWGFFAHRKINYYAVFLLPPDLLKFYKKNIDFITEHAVDPDKRRYAVPDEAPRHYIDIDVYGNYPYNELPRRWDEAVKKFSEDTLMAYGIVPWQIQWELKKLTQAFKEKNHKKILQLSANLGHYISDSHVPLHVAHNHNGQYTNQKGIHGFWEGRVPELLAEKEFNFFIGKADYIKNIEDYVWKRVLESARLADTVLAMERILTKSVKSDEKYSFEIRNGVTNKTYSEKFTRAYHKKLDGMVEKRMRLSIYSTASLWYTAWVNAGSPKLDHNYRIQLTEDDLKEMDSLNVSWKRGKALGKSCE